MCAAATAFEAQPTTGARLSSSPAPSPASFPLLSSRLQFQPSEALDVPSFPFASRWILSKLNGAVGTTIRGMEAYEFSIATSVSGLCTTVLLLIGGGIQLWGPCALVCLA